MLHSQRILDSQATAGLAASDGGRRSEYQRLILRRKEGMARKPGAKRRLGLSRSSRASSTLLLA